jgi:hypothetical protein
MYIFDGGKGVKTLIGGDDGGGDDGDKRENRQEDLSFSLSSLSPLPLFSQG